MPSPLEQLALVDPELFRRFDDALARAPFPLPRDELQGVVDRILTALSQEITFGYALAAAYEKLIATAAPEFRARFDRQVAEAAEVGPTLGKILAEHGPAVFGTGNPALMDAFVRVTGIMRGKGTYTLNRPLEALGRILETGDETGAMAYFDLLADIFAREMTYNQCLHLTRIVPQAVTKMAEGARRWQIPQLHRVIRCDLSLAEPFFDGMEKGLALLTEAGLRRFVDAGVARAGRSERRGPDFFSMASMEAVTLFHSLQVTVSLAGTAGRINRYLRARTGHRLRVRPLSDLPKSLAPGEKDGPVACTDGRFIYLPETLGRMERREENLALYRDLACLESALAEFHTYDFDLERLAQRCRLPAERWAPELPLPDMTAFFQRFDDPSLAEALLTLIEHGRLQRCLARRYAGLARRLGDALCREARRGNPAVDPAPLDACYAAVVMGMDRPGGRLGEVDDALSAAVGSAATVEDAAALVVRFYDEVKRRLPGAAGGLWLRPPFGRRLRPDLFCWAHQETDQQARRLHGRLKAEGIELFRADLFQKLLETGGEIRPEWIRAMARKKAAGKAPSLQARLSPKDLAALLQKAGSASPEESVSDGKVFWYSEWDSAQGDYLDRHCRVLEKTLVPAPGDEVFPKTLARYQGLVRRIRYAFELLRPQGLTLLRPWREGDAFDYRALLDFALDRRAGLIPSDRLYIKRLKQQRDVAVLLLVDLSRSTANSANGTGTQSVLDVEKEAMVLFCEALEVVGDRFAIAGFSGTGRLGVDYYRVKDFDEPMGPLVRCRLSGMTAQRSTRMGAAIRHATAGFASMDAAVRLLILLGDGFPNDVDYKGDHAVEDTRRAINEARSKNIFTHAITVNIAADPMLDDLYGRVRHNIISDVRELPDKLLRIYSALTR